MPPAKSITLHLDFHNLPLNICHDMDDWNLAAAKCFDVDNFISRLALRLVTRLQKWLPAYKKINKWCLFSVIRFSITVNAVFNPYVLFSWTMS